MNLEDFLFKNIEKMNPRLIAWIEKRLRKVASVNEKIEKEYDEIMEHLESAVKPYKDSFQTFAKLPETGRPRGPRTGALFVLAPSPA